MERWGERVRPRLPASCFLLLCLLGCSTVAALHNICPSCWWNGPVILRPSPCRRSSWRRLCFCAASSPMKLVSCGCQGGALCRGMQSCPSSRLALNAASARPIPCSCWSQKLLLLPSALPPQTRMRASCGPATRSCRGTRWRSAWARCSGRVDVPRFAAGVALHFEVVVMPSRQGGGPQSWA